MFPVNIEINIPYLLMLMIRKPLYAIYFYFKTKYGTEVELLILGSGDER